MNVPSKIKIGGHWFDVYRVSEKDSFTIMGQGQHWLNRINIQENMAQSKKESTFLHECLHEMDMQNNWNLSEAQVSSISEVFYAFLVDNGFLK